MYLGLQKAPKRKGYLLLSCLLETALRIPRSVARVSHSSAGECGKARAAGASPDRSLVHGFSDSVFNYTATGGCAAGPWLTGVQGKAAAFLLPAEGLLWMAGMGRAEGARAGAPIRGGHLRGAGQVGSLPERLGGVSGQILPKPNSSSTCCFFPARTMPLRIACRVPRAPGSLPCAIKRYCRKRGDKT